MDASDPSPTRSGSRSAIELRDRDHSTQCHDHTTVHRHLCTYRKRAYHLPMPKNRVQIPAGSTTVSYSPDSIPRRHVFQTSAIRPEYPPRRQKPAPEERKRVSPAHAGALDSASRAARLSSKTKDCPARNDPECLRRGTAFDYTSL